MVVKIPNDAPCVRNWFLIFLSQNDPNRLQKSSEDKIITISIISTIFAKVIFFACCFFSHFSHFRPFPLSTSPRNDNSEQLLTGGGDWTHNQHQSTTNNNTIQYIQSIGCIDSALRSYLRNSLQPTRLDSIQFDSIIRLPFISFHFISSIQFTQPWQLHHSDTSHPHQHYQDQVTKKKQYEDVPRIIPSSFQLKLVGPTSSRMAATHAHIGAADESSTWCVNQSIDSNTNIHSMVCSCVCYRYSRRSSCDYLHAQPNSSTHLYTNKLSNQFTHVRRKSKGKGGEGDMRKKGKKRDTYWGK